MSVKDGVCEFCGQVVLDGKACSCYEATKQRKIKNKIIEANNSVDELFRACDTGEYEIPIQIIDLLKKANELVANELIKSINIKINGLLSASIATDTKGAIKVNRKKVYSDTIQVDER